MYSRQKKKKKNSNLCKDAPWWSKYFLFGWSCCHEEPSAQKQDTVTWCKWTKNQNRCLISQLEMKQENEDIFGKMACNFHLCPLVRNGSSFWYPLIYPMEQRKRKKAAIQLISQRRKRICISRTKLYTLQRALNKECLRLSNFTLQLLSLLIGFTNRSPSISNWSEDGRLFKCPLHCL